MAQPGGVEVHGIDELARGTRKLVDAIDDGAPAALLLVAELAASIVRGRLPRRTGALAASVRTSKTKRKAVIRMGRARVPYAGWIDYGGGHGRPYVSRGRFMYPTAVESEQRAERAGEDSARHEIRRMRWPRPSR